MLRFLASQRAAPMNPPVPVREQRTTKPRWVALSVLGACGALLSACAPAEATEVVVEVYTDVGCTAQTAVAVGRAGELGNRLATALSTQCDATTGYLGRLVVVPRGSDTDELAVEIRVRVDHGSPENCLESNTYNGCIVSRRILRYIPNRTVTLRIDLENPCVNTPCDQETSCVAQGLSRACVSAKIDPEQCVGTCTNEDLVKQSEKAEHPFDPCAPDSNPCQAPATCAVREDATECSCPAGYRTDPGDDRRCVDRNECTLDLDNCDPHADCQNTEGGFTCACRPGYSGDGTHCEQSGCNRTCAKNASCVPLEAGFDCACNSGYKGDGDLCVDIDECQTSKHNCQGLAICSNTDGSFNCSCPSGYKLNGTSCDDINECLTGTFSCDAGTECGNLPGSYECTPIRTQVMVCGRSDFRLDLTRIVPPELSIVEGCAPDDTTKALLVHGDEITPIADDIDGATLKNYVTRGGRVFSSATNSHVIFGMLFAPVDQPSALGNGSDIVPTTVQYSPSDAFWKDNPYIAPAAGTLLGRGSNVAGFPGITPLAGWSESSVALAYRDLGKGRFWITSWDWRDNDSPMEEYTKNLLRYMVTH